MGKKFIKTVVGAALVVVGVYFQIQPLVALGASMLLNVATTALSAGGNQRRQGPPPLNVTLRGTVEFRRLIFGTRRVGGVLVFYGVSGTDNKYLWYVIAYAGHQSNDFGDFWIDERRIDGSTIPSGAGGTVSGYNSRINIWKHYGTSAQTVDTNIDSAFGAWTSSHKLSGTTYAVIRLERDDEIFPDGAPQSVTAEIDGLLYYDARVDSTNGGSGSQRMTNPSTWAFGHNPVWQIRWLLTGGSVHNDLSTRLAKYGLGELDSRIDEPYFIAAANVCDEVLTGAVAPPSGDQVRYRCDLEAHCGETRRDILTALLESMAGTLVNVHGKWRIYAGAYDAPIHTLTDADVYGDLEVQDTVGHDGRYNAVAPIFIDAASQYIQATGNYRTDSSYETQDGGERIGKELQLDGVTSGEQAQRLAEIDLRKSRMMRSVKIPGALNLMRVALHEGMVFSHERYGWTNRVFRAKEKALDLAEEAGKVLLLCQRDDPGVWADMLTADYDTGTSNTDLYQSDGPMTPTSLSATAVTNGILFSIGLPAYVEPGAKVELWEYTSATPFGSASLVATGAGDKVTLPKSDTTTRYYWSRIKNPNNSVSGTVPATSGLAAAAGPLVTNTNQLTDGAGLGSTAIWNNVSGTGKPVDDATQNLITRQKAVYTDFATTISTGDAWTDYHYLDFSNILSGGQWDLDLRVALSRLSAGGYPSWRIVSRRSSDDGDVQVLYGPVTVTADALSTAEFLNDEIISNPASGNRRIAIQFQRNPGGPNAQMGSGGTPDDAVFSAFYYR